MRLQELQRGEHRARGKKTHDVASDALGDRLSVRKRGELVVPVALGPRLGGEDARLARDVFVEHVRDGNDPLGARGAFRHKRRILVEPQVFVEADRVPLQEVAAEHAPPHPALLAALMKVSAGVPAPHVVERVAEERRQHRLAYGLVAGYVVVALERGVVERRESEVGMPPFQRRDEPAEEIRLHGVVRVYEEDRVALRPRKPLVPRP